VSGACVSAVVLAAALALDLLLGDPPNRWHPVAWIGHLIAGARRRFARGTPFALLLAGGVVTIGVAVLAAVAGVIVARAADRLGIAGIALEAAALSCCLSIRGLWRAASGIAAALDRGDLATARTMLGFHLVSRPTVDLTTGEVAAATVESVAENLTDSVVAPALMYLVFGLSGAALYRAVNTADAMIGYREGVLEHFGKLAARAARVVAHVARSRAHGEPERRLDDGRDGGGAWCPPGKARGVRARRWQPAGGERYPAQSRDHGNCRAPEPSSSRADIV
jgi:adenosylcobinamide-phosphate synthase